jgi:hypothetical protein
VSPNRACPVGCSGLTFLFALILLIAPARSEAVPIVSLHPSNLGISSLIVNVVGDTIMLTEQWSSTDVGVLLISQLEPGVDYTVAKTITNSSGVTWTRLANEVLDPAGQAEDALDSLPYPSFVPAGFTTSNDLDGLSFAQGSAIPRTSSAFSSLFTDELIDVRDFLDFSDGTVPAGGVFTVTYGLRENFGTQQPFLLVERPNVFSRPIPEPFTFVLVGGGVAAAILRRKSFNH